MNERRNTGLGRRLKGFMLKRVHSMITCVEFEEFIIRYLDDSLSGTQKKKFEWHLRLCRECREYLAAYQRTLYGANFAYRSVERASLWPRKSRSR